MKLLRTQLIQFIIMVIVGMTFNPMNILIFKFDHLYLSLTLFYGGLLMASNMIWAHEVIHYLSMGYFNKYLFLIGIFLSFSITFLLLRNQLFIDDNQWLRKMISHHSTAISTSLNIYDKTDNKQIKKLAKDIIETQEREINLMKSMLKHIQSN